MNIKCDYCGDTFWKRDDRIVNLNFCKRAHRKRYMLVMRAIEFGVECAHCGEMFIARPWQLRTGDGRYCSNQCSVNGALVPAAHTPSANKKRLEAWLRSDYAKNVRRGRDHPQFMETYVKLGYRYVTGDDGKKVQEHRFVMEKHLGRKLREDEVVHHRNHDKLDNRISNLMVMSNQEHTTLHQRERAPEELRPRAKLTPVAVRFIRKTSRSARSLADAYGVHIGNIHVIRRRGSWQDIQ